MGSLAWPLHHNTVTAWVSGRENERGREATPHDDDGHISTSSTAVQHDGDSSSELWRGCVCPDALSGPTGAAPVIQKPLGVFPGLEFGSESLQVSCWSCHREITTNV